MAQTRPYVDTRSRDLRWARAAKTVLERYSITPRPEKKDGWLAFDITGGTRAYAVYVHPEWGGEPRCNCPDGLGTARADNAGYCKHVIATLLKHKDLNCQLLELFL